MNSNTNEIELNNEAAHQTKIDWLSEAITAKKEGNKHLYKTIMRRVFGKGKHFQQKGTKGAFGKSRALL
jgi:hypothetical protein